MATHPKSSLLERIGYGFGDMSSSMFWKVFSYYLPFFYSNVFGLTLVDAGVLVLVTRIWDAVSDPMMGVIADRTSTRWGKYRPYLLFVAPLFSIAGILLFTTPDWSYGAKLIYAYVTYILMMTVYTGINVPYGAMLGVMTDDPQEKTVFSSFRMFFAYGGSFIALAAWEPLVNLFKSSASQASTASAWQHAMMVIAAVCFVLFLACFALTRERVKTVSTVSVGSDFKALLHNRPWWLLIGAALCFNLFSTVRGATVAYYFADIIGFDQTLDFQLFNFPAFQLLFYAGLFLSVGEVANMVGVALTVGLARRLGKKSLFICVNCALVVLSILFFFVPVSPAGFWLMLLLQVLISILTGIMSPLVWSMCLHGTHLLLQLHGAEVRRCHRWRCRAMAPLGLWLYPSYRRAVGRTNHPPAARVGTPVPALPHVVHPSRRGRARHRCLSFLSPHH